MEGGGGEVSTFRKLFAGKRLQDGHCWYCGVAFDEASIKTSHSLDHVIPQSEGGSTAVENLVDCCRSCNSRKAARGVHQLRESLAIGVINGVSAVLIRKVLTEVATRLPECAVDAESILSKMDARVRALRFHGESDPRP